MRFTSTSPVSNIWCLCLPILLLLWTATTTTQAALQGSKPSRNTPPLDLDTSHRQYICDRYKEYRNNDTIPLRDALQGFRLHPILTWWGPDDEIFRYSPETGIDPDYPGIIVEILDQLALRAGFTWRDSFAVMHLPGPENVTVSRMLEWAVDTYDIAVDWFTRTPERNELGITFLDPWRDGSIVLIAKQQSVNSDANNIESLTNFLKPFDGSVWLLIVLTVVASALVNQLIEYLQGERDDRSLWIWFSDNLYLSSINFSQNFEYGPTSLGGRVFAVSMTLWALLITATYTANLASLLVVSNSAGIMIESIEEAIAAQKPVCTWANSAAGEFVRQEYPKVKRLAFDEELKGYQALQEGKCVLLVTNKDPWLLYKGDNRYNPTCDLEWVGRKLRTLSSGFAVRTDTGDKCSSFIRNVLNVHMQELINEGYLDRFKSRFRRRFQEDNPSTCSDGEEEDMRRRLLLQQTSSSSPASSWSSSEESSKWSNLLSQGITHSSRQLKAGTSAPMTTDPDDDSSALTFQQMLGTFVLHWCLMGLAVVITATTTFYNQWKEKAAETKTTTEEGEKSGSSRGKRRIDWEARYAQLTDREKAIVDVLFQLNDDDNTAGNFSSRRGDREMALPKKGADDVGCKVERLDIDWHDHM